MASIDKRIEKAQKNLQKGKLREALEDYLGIYHDDPNDPDILRTIAELYLQLGQTADAAQAFSSLIDQSHAAGSFNKALFYHRKIIKLLPQDPQKILDLAHYLLHNNKVDEAVAEYLNAAKLYEELTQPLAALQCYERIVELLPQETAYQERLGEFAAAQKQVTVAERAFLAAARQRLARKENDAAAADLKHAQEVNPQNIDTLLQLSHLHELERRWDEMAKMLEPALAEHPVNPQLLDQLGLAYFNLNGLEKADQIWTRLFQVHPDSYHHLVLLAERRLEKSNYGTAYALTMKVKEHCFRIHQYSVVIRLLDTIVQQNPNDTTALSQLAAIHLSLNNREAYKQCLERMFAAYSAAGNYPVAAEVLDNLINVDPGNPDHRQRLEDLKGQLPEANLRSVETHLQKVEAYRRSKDPQVEPVESPRGIEPPVPIPKSSHEELEDLFLQAELFLKYQMNDRAVVAANKLEKMMPLPPDFQQRYLELCEGLGRPPRTSEPAPAPEPPPKPTAPPKTQRAVETPIGRELEALAMIHRKIHLQQGAKAVLYTGVHELGKFMKVTRAFAALSATAKPASSYVEYCAPPRGKSDPIPLNKLLQFCDNLIVGKRRPLFSDRVADDPELAPVRQELRDLGVLSMIVWPLLSQNQVLGFIGVQQGDALRAWTGEEILILQTVAEQISVALAHARLRHLMKTLAVIDEETGLISRHSFFDCLVSEIDRSQKQATTLSVAFLDLVLMQELERTRGAFHSMQLLRDFSQFVVAHTRETDTAVRLDHSIIALILPDTTHHESEWVIQKLGTFSAPDVGGRHRLPEETAMPLFYSASAEALVTAHIDPADSATDAVFRAEQALAQSHQLSGDSSSSARRER